MSARYKTALYTIATLAIAATAVSSCSTPPRSNDSSFSLLRRDASNLVAGRAYLVTGSSGYEKNCDTVLLVPITEEHRKLVSDEFGGKDAGFARDLKSYGLFQALSQRDNVAMAKCDVSGNFKFLRIPQGRYYVLAQTTWLIRLARAGGFIMRTVNISQSIEDLLIAEPAKST